MHYSFILFLSQLTGAFYSGTVDKNETYSNTRTYRCGVSLGENETSVDTALTRRGSNKHKLSSSSIDQLSAAERTDLTHVNVTLASTTNTVDLTHADDTTLNGNGGDDVPNDSKESVNSGDELDASVTGRPIR
jgi:hypothetical protein